MSELEQVKARLGEEVERRAEVLVDVSHQIHAHPEENFQEQFAHDLLTDVLSGEGLPVSRKAYGVDTAFDALPGIGHACGHNVIAAAGLGAGLAAASLAEELGGRVVILGTPAEEGGGGKVRLIDAGA